MDGNIQETHEINNKRASIASVETKLVVESNSIEVTVDKLCSFGIIHSRNRQIFQFSLYHMYNFVFVIDFCFSFRFAVIQGNDPHLDPRVAVLVEEVMSKFSDSTALWWISAYNSEAESFSPMQLRVRFVEVYCASTQLQRE